MSLHEAPFNPARSHIKPITLRNAEDVELNLNRPYLIKGWMYQNQISFWYGPSTSGKTFLMQHVCWSLARKVPVFGKRTTQTLGSVQYHSLEPGQIDERIVAMREAHGPTDRFNFSQDALNLFSDAAAAQQIVERAEETGAALIVIDPISAAMAGANENDYADVSVVIDRLRWIAVNSGAHVACVAHTGKDTDKGQRGSSHWYASGDLVVSVKEDLGSERVVEIVKARDAQKGDAYRFKLNPFLLGTDDEGDECWTLTVQELAQAPRSDASTGKLTKGDRQALAWLQEATDEHGQPPPFDLPAGLRVVTREQWAAVARKRTGDDEKEANRKAITRAITNLTVARKIGVNAPYFWVTR